MRVNNTVIFGALVAVGLLIGGYLLFLRPGPEPVVPEPEQSVDGDASQGEAVPGDLPGPYLKIEVAGQANGTITIDLFEQNAPKHVAQISQLATDGFYNGVYFHRVIDGFMAQTGDGQFAKVEGGDMRRAGMGGSSLPNIEAEFSDISFERGIVGMARAQSEKSANSQFFIMFAPGDFLDGKYTVVGKVTEGMDVVDAIKLGEGQNGSVIGEPDRMVSVQVTE